MTSTIFVIFKIVAMLASILMALVSALAHGMTRSGAEGYKGFAWFFLIVAALFGLWIKYP